MRYGEQIYEIDVPLEDIDFADSDVLAKLKQAFEQRHEALYTYSLKEQEPVLINARVAAIGKLPATPAEPVANDNNGDAAAIGSREIYLGQWLSVPVYAFEQLATAQIIDGPALVESETTTVLLRPGDRATTTLHRWLDIEVQP